MEFSVRASKSDTTKTVFVILEDTKTVMGEIDPDKVAEYFEYGFKVDMQGIARKKGNAAAKAHMEKLGIEVDYQEGVTVATVDETSAMVKKLSPEDKAKVREYLDSLGK